MALESFNAYHSYLTAIEPLNDAERGRLFTALLTYSSTGEVPDLRGNERFVFPQMKWQIDRDKGSYNDFCARQSENGKKGGRPKKPSVNSETQKTQGEGEGEGEGKEYIKKDISNEISQKDRFPYKEITDLYNQICTELPACVKLSESRKKAIRARLSSGYTVDDFKTLFQKTKDSSFLTGGNNRNWIAGFDWLIKDGNMAKVLEGTFDDRSQEQKATSPAPKSIYREL